MMSSKFIAEKSYRMINENNDLVVCYVVHGENKKAALLALEETQNSEKKLQVEVKIHKSQRSLEQNRLLWALLGKMAVAQSGNKRKVSTEECYCLGSSFPSYSSLYETSVQERASFALSFLCQSATCQAPLCSNMYAVIPSGEVMRSYGTRSIELPTLRRVYSLTGSRRSSFWSSVS